MDHLLQPFVTSGLRPVMPRQSFRAAAALMIAVTACLFAWVPQQVPVQEKTLDPIHILTAPGERGLSSPALEQAVSR